MVVGTPGYPTDSVAGALQHRWVLEPGQTTAREEMMDSLVTEFPTINDDYIGRRNRYSYAVAYPGSGSAVSMDPGSRTDRRLNLRHNRIQ